MRTNTATFETLVCETNTLALTGGVASLLRQVERELPEYRGLAQEFRLKALSGSRENAVRVSHEYAYRFAASTLQVDRDVDVYLAMDEAGDDEEFG